jgi:hypothetical protein
LCPSAAFARPAAGPVNTSPPFIIGTPRVGGTVTVAPGTWTSSSGTITYGYAWQNCDAQGNACQALPFTTQTVSNLQLPVGSTIRAVVTATDATGFGTATTDPLTVGEASGTIGVPTIALVRPANGSVVHTPKVTIVLKVAPSDTIRAVRVDGAKATHGPNGLWSLTERVQPGKQTIHVSADDGFAGAHKTFAFTVVPRVTAIQGFTSPGSLTAPGCTTCSIRDAPGDDRSAPPDIESATSTYTKGTIVITLVTYGTISPGHGGHPCIDASTRQGPHELGVTAGCFEGPHTGTIFGAVCGRHLDANQDCGPAHMSFPNSHTTVFRFRPSQIGNPSAFFWQAWVLYPGDRVEDTVPNQVVPGREGGPNCWIKQQIRAQPASSYGFGRNRCRQTGVVEAS